MTRVLIDSSAWIDFFRGLRPAVSRIDPLLAEGSAATTEIIRAEITSGARTRKDFERLSTAFSSLELLPIPANIWRHVAEARFALARRGVQAGIIDLTIALIAERESVRLLTRDRDFKRIASIVPVALEVF